MALGGMKSGFVEYEETYANGASGSSKEIHWTNGNTQKVSMTDDCTFSFNSPITGILYLIVNNNDPFGPYTATWPGTVIWLDNTAPTFTNNRTCICKFLCDGTNYYGEWGDYY